MIGLGLKKEEAKMLASDVLAGKVLSNGITVTKASHVGTCYDSISSLKTCNNNGVKEAVCFSERHASPLFLLRCKLVNARKEDHVLECYIYISVCKEYCDKFLRDVYFPILKGDINVYDIGQYGTIILAVNECSDKDFEILTSEDVLLRDDVGKVQKMIKMNNTASLSKRCANRLSLHETGTASCSPSLVFRRSMSDSMASLFKHNVSGSDQESNSVVSAAGEGINPKASEQVSPLPHNNNCDDDVDKSKIYEQMSPLPRDNGDVYSYPKPYEQMSPLPHDNNNCRDGISQSKIYEQMSPLPHDNNNCRDGIYSYPKPYEQMSPLPHHNSSCSLEKLSLSSLNISELACNITKSHSISSNAQQFPQSLSSVNVTQSLSRSTHENCHKKD